MRAKKNLRLQKMRNKPLKIAKKCKIAKMQKKLPKYCNIPKNCQKPRPQFSGGTVLSLCHKMIIIINLFFFWLIYKKIISKFFKIELCNA